METVLSSKTKTVIISPERPFVIIGERINPTGRKKLAEELAAGDFSRVRADALARSVERPRRGTPGRRPMRRDLGRRPGTIISFRLSDPRLAY
jgi:hypothetical protein